MASTYITHGGQTSACSPLVRTIGKVKWTQGQFQSICRDIYSHRAGKPDPPERANIMTVISVIIGSTRQGRFSEKPAQWIFNHLKKRGGVDARLLDLRDFPRPFFDQAATPAMPGRPPYQHEAV